MAACPRCRDAYVMYRERRKVQKDASHNASEAVGTERGRRRRRGRGADPRAAPTLDRPGPSRRVADPVLPSAPSIAPAVSDVSAKETRLHTTAKLVQDLRNLPSETLNLVLQGIFQD